MNCFKFIILFVVVLLNYSCNSIAQQKTDWSVKIDSLIESKSVRPFNGVVLVSKNGKTLYSKAYGFSNVETKSTLKIENQFEVMSVTKQITAVLILKQVEKGIIDLNAPIKQYLPNLSIDWLDSITVKQLLNHTSGISSFDKPLLFKPGSDFKYDDKNYILLGKILESVTKKSYSELANALFKKLKMNSTFCYSDNENPNLVSGHINKENSFTIVQKVGITKESLSANGVLSSVNDLTVWNKNLYKGKLLKPESFKLMTSYSITAQHDVFGKEKVGYGLGLRIVDNKAVKYFGHTGLGSGFAAVNLYFPKDEISLIVLENQMNENFDIGYYCAIEIKKLLLKSKLFEKE